MDHVFFLSEERWKAARETSAYDMIIVGTGFCGLAVAERALKNRPDLRILMIERGSFFLPEHFQNLPLPMKATLGGLSETFPWTLAASTARGQDGAVRWQHGMVNFFGGRSTLWSAWCPEPTSEEMDGWPQEVKDVLFDEERKLLPAAKELLNVRSVDTMDDDACNAFIQKADSPFRPVFRNLQKRIQGLLRGEGAKEKLHGLCRAEAAPLASGSRSGVDFERFSTPGPLLELVQRYKNLHIVTNCTVRRILKQGDASSMEGDAVATALDTTRGILPLNEAKLVLAMGTLPPVTLIRNSFPELASKVGQRFSSHFITSIAARVSDSEFLEGETLEQLQLGACYVAGTAGPKDRPNYKKQFHVQLTALYDKDPGKNSGKALRYMPDVVATASPAQLQTSNGYVVFICAVLGEMDYRTKENNFLANPSDADVTTNSTLRMKSESEEDTITWRVMDDFTFAMLEKVLAREEGTDGARGRKTKVQYWHGDDVLGRWTHDRPHHSQYRVPAVVHESSTLHIGTDEDKEAPVNLEYRLKGVSNVFVTGAGLWPQGGSWNPTLTMVALAMDLADKLFPRQPLDCPRASVLTDADVVNAFDSADNVYICVKDRESRFQWANTNFAQLAGFASPRDIVGELDWNSNHIEDDKAVVEQGRSFVNHREFIRVGDREVKIVTQKGAFRKAGGVAGVTVCFSKDEACA